MSQRKIRHKHRSRKQEQERETEEMDYLAEEAHDSKYDRRAARQKIRDYAGHYEDLLDEEF